MEYVAQNRQIALMGLSSYFILSWFDRTMMFYMGKCKFLCLNDNNFMCKIEPNAYFFMTSFLLKQSWYFVNTSLSTLLCFPGVEVFNCLRMACSWIQKHLGFSHPTPTGVKILKSGTCDTFLVKKLTTVVNLWWWWDSRVKIPVLKIKSTCSISMILRPLLDNLFYFWCRMKIETIHALLVQFLSKLPWPKLHWDYAKFAFFG